MRARPRHARDTHMARPRPHAWQTSMNTCRLRTISDAYHSPNDGGETCRTIKGTVLSQVTPYDGTVPFIDYNKDCSFTGLKGHYGTVQDKINKALVL